MAPVREVGRVDRDPPIEATRAQQRGSSTSAVWCPITTTRSRCEASISTAAGQGLLAFFVGPESARRAGGPARRSHPGRRARAFFLACLRGRPGPRRHRNILDEIEPAQARSTELGLAGDRARRAAFCRCQAGRPAEFPRDAGPADRNCRRLEEFDDFLQLVLRLHRHPPPGKVTAAVAGTDRPDACHLPIGFPEVRARSRMKSSPAGGAAQKIGPDVGTEVSSWTGTAT